MSSLLGIDVHGYIALIVITVILFVVALIVLAWSFWKIKPEDDDNFIEACKTAGVIFFWAILIIIAKLWGYNIEIPWNRIRKGDNE